MGKDMHCKILKVVEYGFRVTKLGGPIAAVAGRFTGSKKGYVTGAREKLEQFYGKTEVPCVVKERTYSSRYHLQIIIPMHNAAKYVEQCITSILSQKTKYNYQMVFVDDGSTDNTVEMVQKFLSDERIELITKENTGAAGARNAGLEKLMAEYIMFVDVDDVLKEDAIEVLLDTAYREQAQIVEGGYEIFDTKVLFTETHKYQCFKEACGKLWGFPWGKVISTSLMANMSFPEGYWYEDTIMSYLVYPRSKKTVTIENIVYGYRKNPSGFSHIRGNNGKLLDTYWVMELMLRDMKALKIQKSQSIYEQYLKSILTGSKRLMFMKKDIRKAALSMYSQMLSREWDGFSTKDKRMQGFERAIRNNRYVVYTLLVLCL